jgi:hypothetical protein
VLEYFRLFQEDVIYKVLTEEELVAAEHKCQLSLDDCVKARAEDILHQLRVIQLQG